MKDNEIERLIIMAIVVLLIFLAYRHALSVGKENGARCYKYWIKENVTYEDGTPWADNCCIESGHSCFSSSESWEEYREKVRWI